MDVHSYFFKEYVVDLNNTTIRDMENTFKNMIKSYEINVDIINENIKNRKLIEE